MKKIISMLLIVISVMSLAACSQSNEQPKTEKEQQNAAAGIESVSDNNIVKLKSKDIDLSNITYQISESQRNEKLEKAITEALNYDKEIDGIVQYYYNRIDLNGDEKNETFVYLIGPYVSGSGGSTLLIFEDDEDEFKLVSRITLVRNPIIVSDHQTNGWKDLVMQVSGGGIEPYYSEIKFDGNKYPGNPSVQPKVEAGSIVKGSAVIADDTLISPGIVLQ